MSEENQILTILGIDPGLATAGYGVINRRGNKLSYVDSGEMTTQSKTPFASRLLAINSWLREIIEKVRPQIGVVEETFYGSNAKTALQMGHARGAILLTLSQANVECAEYSARSIKQSVVGNGSASKEQVEYMVKNILSVKELPGEHASDALAAAICHANQGEFGL